MRRIRRIIILARLSLVSCSWGYCRCTASQSVPKFYELAMELQPEEADQAGDEFERQVVAMASDLEEGHRWSLVLTDHQVNGWLATDLLQKFPNLLPKEVEAPRIAFREQMASLACRVNTEKVSTVLSVNLEAYLTNEPNEIAIRVQRVRAGVLPVPLTKILDQITEVAHQSGISLRWTQREGDPVALVALPVERPELRPGVVLERLEMGTGELVVEGVADDSGTGSQSRLAESTSGETPNSQR